MENDRKSSRPEVERYDLEILLRRPSLRSNIPRRVSQICTDEMCSKETKCGAGCIRGQWLQSFANRNSFTLVYGILGSFYGSYYAYFYGVVSTLEKRFKISSQTIGTIAATGDAVQVVICFILSQFVPKAQRPKWIGVGVLFIVTSTVIFTLPHFLYEPQEPQMFITRHSTYHKNGTDVGQCPEESELCAKNLEGRNGPIILLILAQILHGIGGSLYFIVGKSYEDDNIEKYKPPALLSLLSVLKMLGPAFGYWLSSISLKIFEYPKSTADFNEEEPLWIGAWWLGSLVIGFILIVPGFFVIFFPTTLPKAVIKRIRNQLEGIPEGDGNLEKKGELSILKKVFINSTIKCTHFAAIFNSLGFIAYFIFLPKYVETQFRISTSNANLIAEGVRGIMVPHYCFVTVAIITVFSYSSVTLISAAVGIVFANSVITRYRPSARVLASWTVIVGILSVGGLASYIFLDCHANDYKTKIMATQHVDNTCRCVNSSFFPICDEFNEPFISLCHAGCESILHINNTQDYEICNQTALPSNAKKVFKGFCNVDCHSTFLKFIIVTCSMTFIYATGRTSIYWFETQSEENEEKSLISNFGTIIGFLTSIPAPIVFGHLLDESCLLWEGNCKGSGNCWLYNNEKLRFNMNFTAIGFAIIGILFDVGVWYSVKNLKLFDGAEYYMDEIDEI